MTQKLGQTWKDHQAPVPAQYFQWMGLVTKWTSNIDNSSAVQNSWADTFGWQKVSLVDYFCSQLLMSTVTKQAVVFVIEFVNITFGKFIMQFPCNQYF